MAEANSTRREAKEERRRARRKIQREIDSAKREKARADKRRITEKRCPKCDQKKDRGKFSPMNSRPDGLRPWCKVCHNAANVKWRERNPEKQKALVADWAEKNPGRVKEKSERWSKKNPGKASESAKKFRTLNPEKAREHGRRGNRKRRSTVSGALKSRIGTQLRVSLIRGKGGVHCFDILGYSVDQLREHLERQFTKGMDWSKFMAGEIHIDHIVPLASFEFDSIDSPDLIRAWSLPNLRPLWALENIKKSDKRLFLI